MPLPRKDLATGTEKEEVRAIKRRGPRAYMPGGAASSTAVVPPPPPLPLQPSACRERLLRDGVGRGGGEELKGVQGKVKEGAVKAEFLKGGVTEVKVWGGAARPRPPTRRQDRLDQDQPTTHFLHELSKEPHLLRSGHVQKRFDCFHLWPCERTLDHLWLCGECRSGPDPRPTRSAVRHYIRCAPGGFARPSARRRGLAPPGRDGRGAQGG